MRGKTAGFMIAAALIGLAAITAAGIFLYTRPDYVMQVNGASVSREEFQIMMDEQAVETYSHFKSQYGIEDSEDFWDIQIEGKTPSDYNKELAKEALIQKKCVQQLMRENGLVEDISFEAFQKEWELENERRKKVKDNGGILYGPVEYGLREYDIYLMSNREIELKRKLQEGPLAVTEDEMRRYYEENKETKYKIQDTITVEIDGETVIFEPQFARHDSTERPELHQAALEMKEGEVRTVMLANGGTSVIACLKKERNGYLTFDDAKDSLLQALTDEKYEQLIAQRVQTAQITVNDSVYKRLKQR